MDNKPVAWLDSDGFPWSEEGIACRTTKDTYVPLYTHPHKELSDEEIYSIMVTCIDSPEHGHEFRYKDFARAIIKASRGEE